MSESHRINRRRALVGLVAFLVAGLGAAVAVLFMPAQPTEATSPPPTYTLSVTVVGTDCSVTKDPNASSYSSGTVVTLTAVPASGWLFDHWEWGLTGNTNPTTITMNSNKMLRAVFVNSSYYTLTTAISPSSAGYMTPTWGSYAPGSQVQISATAYSGYRFGYWTGNPTFSSTSNPATVTMNSHRSVTANYIRTYTLTTTVVAQGGGTDFGAISLNPTGGVYDVDTVVSMTAVASAGWRFRNWSGDAIFSDNPETVTMTGNKNVTATFYRIYNLSTTVIGQGTVSPAAGTYAIGDEVELTATPATGWRFKEWTGDASGTTSPVTVMMDNHKSVGATFVTDTTLSISTWREGTVSPGVGDHPYQSDQSVQVTATPALDTRFSHWEGDVPASEDPEDPSILVRMDINRSLMAVFVRRMTLETSAIGGGSVDPVSVTVDQGAEVTLTATPDPDWAFRGWIGDVDSTENPLTLTVDAPMSVVAEFVNVSDATELDLVADLGALLYATGDLAAPGDVTNLGFDRGGAAAAVGNGLPDAAEMMVLEAILQDATYNRVPYGGTGHQTVYNAWSANLAQAELDLASSSAPIQRAIAAYMTLGADGHSAWAVAAALEVATVTLDPANYTGAPGLGEHGNADGDRAWNRLEWKAVLEEYQVMTPTMTEAAVYAAWALDPSLPADEDVDIGLDLPDGDGTDWDYSYLPQGTVTFQSAPDLPIEIRILDPPGREDVPVPVGEPVDIPLGAELLVTLAEGANPDWFSTWSAGGNMIDGSVENTERFRLMRGGTIQPSRRAVTPVTLPESPQGESAFTVAWSGVGPFGHMVDPGSSAGGNVVEVPDGAFLKLRAFRAKPAPGGGAGTSTAGNNVLYAQQWSYRYGSDQKTAYAYGSSPVFNVFIAEYMQPLFGYTSIYGYWTHTVTTEEGGFVGIGMEEPLVSNHENGGLVQSVTVPRLMPGSETAFQDFMIRAFEFPGYDRADWGGDREIVGQYPVVRVTNATGPIRNSAIMYKMPTIDFRTVMTGNGPDPIGAYIISDPARKYWDPDYTVHVEINLVLTHCFWLFDRWHGWGDAFLEDIHRHGEPDIGNPLALDDPNQPIVDTTIWIEMGPAIGIQKSRFIEAHLSALEAPEERIVLVEEGTAAGANYGIVVKFVYRDAADWFAHEFVSHADEVGNCSKCSTAEITMQPEPQQMPRCNWDGILDPDGEHGYIQDIVKNNNGPPWVLYSAWQQYTPPKSFPCCNTTEQIAFVSPWPNPSSYCYFTYEHTQYIELNVNDPLGNSGTMEANSDGVGDMCDWVRLW